MGNAYVQISEAELRTAVRQAIHSHNWETAPTVMEEFGIERGAARVDIALIGDRLMAIEIKSDFDTLARFANQIHAYNRVFDEIVLVAGRTWASAAESIVPPWWGIVAADRDVNGVLVLDTVRRSTQNLHQDELSLAMLLWREEAIGALSKKRPTESVHRLNKSQLFEKLTHEFSLSELRDIVIGGIKSRERSNIVAQPELDGDLSHPYAML